MARSEVTEPPRADSLEGWPLPEAQPDWFGEEAAERTLLDAYRGNRMHHAWLIGGPKGIGKATLAYRFARFVLAHPDPTASAVANANDLFLPESDPSFRQVASRAHPGLLPLDRPYMPDRKRFLTEVSVDQIRRTVSFFGTTGGGGGWRVAVVDPADEMNASAANALLKVLEEPPSRSLFFIISHAPGRLLPTIRSRCRRLDLQPLSANTITSVLQNHEVGQGRDQDMELVAALAEGSLRRAILLYREDGVETYRQFAAFTERLPEPDVQLMHNLADRVSLRTADDAFDGFVDILRGWLDRRVRGLPEPGGAVDLSATLRSVPLARWAEVWEKIESATAEAEALNLDRKQLALNVLMTFAHAARM